MENGISDAVSDEDYLNVEWSDDKNNLIEDLDEKATEKVLTAAGQNNYL